MSREHEERTGSISRRAVTTGAVAAGTGLTLAACGADESTVGTGTSSSTTPAASPSTSVTGEATGDASAALTQVADVPVGSALAVEASGGVPVIVAQPSAGEIVAFSARCPHQGCAVAVAGVELDCPCHGSRFDAFTGAVLEGPALDPLTPFAVTVTDGAVVADA